MPEPENAAGGPWGMAGRFAGLLSFLVSLALAAISIGREVPLADAPSTEALATPMAGEIAAVLPFDDVLVTSPYAVGQDKTKPTSAPDAVHREETGEGAGLVCELGAASNHLGPVDGKALARALAREYSRAGLFLEVRFVGSLGELQDETVLIQGKVLEAALRIRKDGKRDYAVGVEISAVRSWSSFRNEPMPLWEKTLRRKAHAAGVPPAYELRALVDGLCGEAVSGLREALQHEVRRP